MAAGQVGRCTAHKSNGQPCGSAPLHGTNVCRHHGGFAPHVRLAAQRNVRRQKAISSAAKLLVKRGEPVDQDPLAAMMRMLRVAAAAERAYAELIERELPDGRILVEVGSHAMGFREEAHPYIALWMAERKMVAECASLLIKAGFEERMIRLVEKEAAAVAQVITNVITALGLPPERVLEARRLAAAELRAIETTAVAV